jgi:hypothetical protein
MTYQAKYNEWIEPSMKNFEWVCCDCGLTHKVDFKIRGRHVELRARRAEKLTAKERKRSKTILLVPERR